MRAAVVLAAGSSRRWGAGNKLLDRRGGATMLGRVLGIAAAAPVQRIIVVAGWQTDRIARAAERRASRTLVVRARDHREGLGASLRAAARALRPIDREVLLFLADMPWLDPRLAARLLRLPGVIVRPVWNDRLGHPVLLRRAGIEALAEARGDRGPGRGAPARSVPADRRCVADRDRAATRPTPPPRLR